MNRLSSFAQGLRRLDARQLARLEADHDVAAGVTPGREDSEIEELLRQVPVSAFPLDAARKRGWLPQRRQRSGDRVYDDLAAFFRQHTKPSTLSAFMRQPRSLESEKAQRQYASTLMWLAKVLYQVKERPPKAAYVPGSCTLDFMGSLAKLSVTKAGPRVALDRLWSNGIAVVIEEQLPYSKIDGAIALSENSVPVIGLSLRYDRIDNFWFTLMHELGHLMLHIDSGADQFVDDLDETTTDVREREANRIAGEALIPRSIWNRSEARRNPSNVTIRRLANEIGVHPAIIAGRVQRELDNYKLFRDIVDAGSVREQLLT